MLIYAVTVFLSAFLLFQIQPVIGKWILPSFGGSAAVWTTCMLFFQVVLLLGYVYSDWSVRRLTPRRQVALHLGLLVVSMLALAWRPDVIAAGSGGEIPILRILALLWVSIGIPYFTLATTTPLIQAWYAQGHQTALPYRLFALSNLASILALLAYPVLVEPYLPIRRQFQAWGWAYFLFALFCLWSALRNKPMSAGHPAAEADGLDSASRKPGRGVQLVWMALAACASVLLLAITNHLTQNVAPMPFLWVLPLGVYLLSFVLCFDGTRWINKAWWRILIGPALLTLGVVLLKNNVGGLIPTVAILTVALLLCCMFCHSELARLKPHPRYLTSFYLMVSVGGALGGVFVGLIAPVIFNGFYELPVGMVLCAILALHVWSNDASPRRLANLVVAAFAGFLIFPKVFSLASDTQLMTRNFYGCLRIGEIDASDPRRAIKVLYHGSIIHGAQFVAPSLRRRATTYFGPETGVGLAIASIRNRSIRVGVIGLGAGTLASYGRKGDYYRFYEINPLVIDVARNEFSFVRDSEATVDTVLGDGRLALEREAAQGFDLFVLDAFSGDSIPVHLLTKEAFAVYFRHLKPDGVLAAHVSNRYLDLKSVVERIALLFGKDAVAIESGKNSESRALAAVWVVVTSDRSLLERPQLRAAGVRSRVKPAAVAWSDEYSNLLGALK